MSSILPPYFSAGIVLVFLLAGSLFVVTRRKKTRTLYVVAVALVLVFIVRDYISAYLLVHAQAGRLTVRSFLWLLSAGIVTVVFGRVYCGWVCPFGAVMHLVNRITPWKKTVPWKIHRLLRIFKYVLLAAAAIFTGFRFPLLAFEPFEYLFMGNISFPFFWVSLLYVAVSFFIPYFWCRYFCFLGAWWGILSVFPVLRYKFRCSGNECSQCAALCPTQAITPKGAIFQAECVRCNECQSCKKC